MKPVKKIALLLLFVAISMTISLGQEKFEIERRISHVEVPSTAVEFIENIQIKSKVKWYYEQSQTGNSIEAKFIFNKRKYSIEFDTLGNIEDVEIVITWSQIHKQSQKRIVAAMDSLFSKHSLGKIQIQYTGPKNTLLALAKEETSTKDYTTKYEMIVKGKKEGRPRLYEITFSEQGKLLTISTIIFKNSDNLEY